MLTIRLQRRGRKNDPNFRVIVVDSKRSPKSGNYLEMVGSYDPRTDRIDLKKDRITYWISEGAQTSDTVHNLLISQKVIEGKKVNVLPKKTPPKEGGEPEAAEERTSPAAEAVEEKASENASAVSSDVAPEEKAA